MFLTVNEKNVLRFLAVNVRDYSINEIARKCALTPNGAYKILKKLEHEGVIKPKKVANILSYKLDFSNVKTLKILELSFIPEKLEGRIKHRAEDLELLKNITSICIVFGSYMTEKKEPEDLDLLFVLEKEEFGSYKKTINKIKDITPVKIQDIIQNSKDLMENIKKEDPVILASINKGIVLWGFEKLAKMIENVHK